MIGTKKLAIGLGTAITALGLGLAAWYTTSSATQNSNSAMTSAQADLLALARFNDYQNGVSAIDAEIPISGQEFTLDGRVDWQSHLGYATLASAQQAGGTELLQWTPNGIAVRGNWTGPLPATPPADGWTVRAWQQGADLDSALQLILDLAANRPENAQQLRQSGAIVLRETNIGAAHVTIFAGPPETQGGANSHTRYWIADNGTLRRFEALIDGSTTWTEVNITPGSAPPVPQIPGMQ